MMMMLFVQDIVLVELYGFLYDTCIGLGISILPHRWAWDNLCFWVFVWNSWMDGTSLALSRDWFGLV